MLREMQEIFYTEAPYHVLYYDAELHAYRTDRFAGWTNQPAENGTPLFGYGPFGYTKLTVAGEEPSPSPGDSGATESPGAPTASSPAGSAGASGGATPAPTSPSSPAASSGPSQPLLIGIVALIAVLAVAFLMMRRRRPAADEE
jgi:hypothetical protein